MASVAAVAKTKHPLAFSILSECKTSKARAGILTLPHALLETPIFMPVGTQGTMKGLIPEQIESTGCRMMLSNTYHLGMRPGKEILSRAGGLHKFMGWDHGLLTDSGGFQMVSLIKLLELTEQGVNFTSPYDGQEILLTPEESISIQNAIGADIMMQLDDVVSSTVSGPRVEEAMHRTIRWLDRSIAAHRKPAEQNIFPIVQGGLDDELRAQCVDRIHERDVAGFAIGGLSGGEEKDDFWKMVHLSTDKLVKDKPRYLMGVGFAVDLVVCVALGCDMFDCVFPTRTARFGTALVMGGHLNLKNKMYKNDFGPIDSECSCNTCSGGYSRAYLHRVVTHYTFACHLISVHNIAFQMRLMTTIRESIIEGKFVEFVKGYMELSYPDRQYPKWVKEALEAVHIQLE